MLTALIIEDELASRETLRNYLAKYCDGVSVVGEASNIQEGLKLIQQHQPKLIFLDVEMPYGNAFDLLEQVGEPSFETIFVTAFSHYAVKALNVSASYYLLKPIDIDELIAAVDKVKKGMENNQQSFHTRILIDNLNTAGKQLQKVVLPIMDGFEVVHVKEIIRLQANGNFTDFYLKDGSKKMICRTLKFYDEILSELDFIRVHKSHLINLQYVTGYKKGKGGQLTMEGGAIVDVSASRKQELMSRF